MLNLLRKCTQKIARQIGLVAIVFTWLVTYFCFDPYTFSSVSRSSNLSNEAQGNLSDSPFSPSFASKSLRHITYGMDGKCEPIFNIMYLKTHKCASSTMQSVLFRYACTHDQNHKKIPCGQDSRMHIEAKQAEDSINSYNSSKERKDESDSNRRIAADPIYIAVPSQGVYAGSPERFRADMLQQPSWLLPPSRLVNMFALHTRMDAYELQKVLHKNSLWVTILRRPVDLYVSMFTYFKLNVAVGATLEGFLQNPLTLMKRAKRFGGNFGANQMTFDLGYDSSVFYDDRKIDQMIEEVEETFDLVLIMERLDESLVILGRALCWSLDDLVSLSKNVRSKAQPLTQEEKNKLEALNYSDERLYQHFSRQFDEVVKLYGKEGLEEEVRALREKRDEVEKYCVKEVVEGHHPKASIKEYSGDVLGFQLARPEDPLCRALAWNSVHYISYFRQRMKNTFQGL